MFRFPVLRRYDLAPCALRTAPFVFWLFVLAFLTHASWFLCDDAFISFRYVRNLVEGHGLVFNRGERVEGYSNFLWVIELAALWAAFGLRPEHAAPWLSVVYTGATLAVLLWWILRIPDLAHRRLVAWMALGLVCSSATFAVWTSGGGGGLGTRQLTFFVVAAFVLLTLHPDRPKVLLCVSLLLALASLTRPEGPLFVASCALWLLASQARVRTGRWLPPWRSLSWLLGPCLAIVAAHYLWRYSYYGEWLPNTYYAKHVRPWYSMGLRYLVLAALETGLPILLALGAVAFVSRWRRRRCIAYILPFLALVLHMGYLARIGGDHFEFRPLDFYWPLLALPASEGLVLIALRLARLLRRPRPRAVRRTSVVLFLVLLLYANVQQAAIVVAPDHFKHAYPTGWAIFPILDEENAPWLQRVPGMPLILLLQLPSHPDHQPVRRPACRGPPRRLRDLHAALGPLRRPPSRFPSTRCRHGASCRRHRPLPFAVPHHRRPVGPGRPGRRSPPARPARCFAPSRT